MRTKVKSMRLWLRYGWGAVMTKSSIVRSSGISCRISVCRYACSRSQPTWQRRMVETLCRRRRSTLEAHGAIGTRARWYRWKRMWSAVEQCGRTWRSCWCGWGRWRGVGAGVLVRGGQCSWAGGRLARCWDRSFELWGALLVWGDVDMAQFARLSVNAWDVL